MNLNLTSTSSFFTSGMNVSLRNVSGFIQIQPSNPYIIGYFLFIKYDGTPVYNNSDPSQNSYDILQFFCPSNLIKSYGETFHQYYLNSSQLKNSLSNFTGFSFREMDSREYSIYCVNGTNSTALPLNIGFVNFTQEVGFRSFAVGCSYLNYQTGEWLSDGIKLVEKNTTLMMTTCASSHLTEFAGGITVLPPALDFATAFAHADFMSNPTVYITLITIGSLYVILAIYARVMDIKDKSKLGMNILPDNYPLYNYCYEIIAFTGNRKEAQCDSSVRFVLTGTECDTGVRVFASKNGDRNLFRKGGIDSFLMTVER
jgi:hypothetical protein